MKQKSKTAPEDFTVEVGMRVWAAQNTPGIDVDFETASFKDYEFPRAHSNWNATWRNWMREAYRRKNRYLPVTKAAPVSVEMETVKGLRVKWGVPEFREPLPGENPSQYRRAMDDARVAKHGNITNLPAWRMGR